MALVTIHVDSPTIHIHLPVDLTPVLSKLSELEIQMATQGEDLKREMVETRQMLSATTTAITTLASANAALAAQLANASNGLTGDEAAAAAQELNTAQDDARQVLIDAGFTPPGEPGPDLPVPEPVTT